MQDGDKDDFLEEQIERLKASGPLPEDPFKEFEALNEEPSAGKAFFDKYGTVLFVAILAIVIGRWSVSLSSDEVSEDVPRQAKTPVATLDQASLALQNLLKPSPSPALHTAKGMDDKARTKLERETQSMILGKSNPFAGYVAPTPKPRPTPVQVVERPIPIPLPPAPTPPPPRATLRLVGVVDGVSGPTALVEAQAPGVPSRMRLKTGDKVVTGYHVSSVQLDRVEIKGPQGRYYLSFQPLDIELPRR